MVTGPSAPMVADVMAKKWRNFFEAFRASSATSPTASKTLSELRITDSNLLHIQVRRKVIVQMPDNKYYLDEVRLKQISRLRNRLAIIPLVVIVIVLLVLLFYR